MASVLGLSTRSMGSASASTSGIERYNSNRDRPGQLHQGLISNLSNVLSTPSLPANGTGVTPELNSQAGRPTLHAPAPESLSQTATISPHLQRDTQGTAAAVFSNAASYLWWFPGSSSPKTDSDTSQGTMQSPNRGDSQAVRTEGPADRDPAQSSKRSSGSGRKPRGVSKLGQLGAPGVPADIMDEDYMERSSCLPASTIVQTF